MRHIFHINASMDFHEVCTVFGGTPFVEESRRDLSAIQIDLEERHNALSSAHVNEKPSLLLLAAIHSLQAGRFNVAHSLLHDLHSNDSFGPRWVFRSFTYQILHLTWTNFPPTFRFTSLLTGPSHLNIPAKEVILAVQAIRSRCIALSEHVTELDIFELSIVSEIFIISFIHLEAARKQNERCPRYEPGAQDEEAQSQQVHKCRLRLEQLQQQALSYKLHAVSAYIRRLLYELSSAEGRSNSLRYIEDIKEDYDNVNDILGEALVEIIRGDVLISSPFTSPLCLNFELADGWDEFGGLSDQDSTASASSENLLLPNEECELKRMPML